MRTIRKGAEPNSLAQHRHTDGADYQNYRDKDALRTFLVREQRGLCCYCMARVRADRDAMKIEHWHSQSGHPQEQLDYTNLLASCMGNDGRYNAEPTAIRAKESGSFRGILRTHFTRSRA